MRQHNVLTMDNHKTQFILSCRCDDCLELAIQAVQRYKDSAKVSALCHGWVEEKDAFRLLILENADSEAIFGELEAHSN